MFSSLSRLPSLLSRDPPSGYVQRSEASELLEGLSEGLVLAANRGEAKPQQIAR